LSPTSTLFPYTTLFRSKQFSLMILEIVDLLPPSVSTKVISYQIAKSGTSVGANYRATCRARSDNEFISKMNIVLEESDESMFWLDRKSTRLNSSHVKIS